MKLSEIFLYPLGLLGLLAIPIIVIIYILRSKYKTKNVSSTFIWKRSLKYVKRRIPLNLIMSLLLILQILTVIAASLAIARPTIKPTKSEEKIIILDASASMLTTNGSTTRFDDAVAKIKEEAEFIGPNYKVSIILAGDESVLIADRLQDEGELLTAIKKLKCGTGDANIEDAFDKALPILDKNAEAKVHFYTDRDYIEKQNVSVTNFQRKGEWNSGIISFTDNELAQATEFFAMVGNYGTKTKCNISLIIDGKTLASTTLDFEKGQTRNIRFTHAPTSTSVQGEDRVLLLDTKGEKVKNYKTATIKINTDDGYSFDNELTIYSKPKTNLDILYVSKYVEESSGRKHANNSILYIVMDAAGIDIDSRNMYQSIDDVEDEKFRGYDLYIFEGVDVHEFVPTDGAVWYLNCKGLPSDIVGYDPISGVQTGVNYGATSAENKTGYLVEQALSGVIEEIVRNVNFSIPMKLPTLEGIVEIPATVTQYKPIENVGSADSVFKPLYVINDIKENAEGVPVVKENCIMAAGNVNSVRVVVSSFDLRNSTLGAYISDFPILVKNLIKYSTPDPLAERSAMVGQTITFNYPVGAIKVVQKYNGAVVKTVTVDSTTELMDTIIVDDPGKYEWVVTTPTGQKDPMNLDKELTVDDVYTLSVHMGIDESIIHDLPSGMIVAPIPAEIHVEEPARVDILPYIIAIFIFLLIVEWGVYYRDQY